MSVEVRLRETFEANADRAAVPTAVYAAVLTRHRRSQRRRIAATAVGLSAALALVAPTLSALDHPPTADRDVATAGAGDPGPTRGSLADDADFVASVLRAPWGAGPDSLQPPVADRRVVFAGDVLGGRWARVLAKVQGTWMGVWLNGPADASGDQLTIVDEPNRVDLAQPQSEYDTTAPGHPLLVVSQPGDEVSYSPAPVVAANGSVARSFIPLASEDGVASVSLPALPGIVAIRVFRGGEQIYEGSPQGGVGGPDDHPWTAAGVAAASVGSRGEPLGDMRDDMYPLPNQTLMVLTSQLGLYPSTLSPRVLWTGSAGGFDTVRADLLIMTARLPSGAVAMVGGFWADEIDLGGQCMMHFLPSGTSVDDRLTAMRCDIQQDDQKPGTVSELAVLAPTTATTAQIFAGSEVVGSLGLSDGAGVLEMPAGADRVVAYDSGGAVVGDEAIAPITELSFYGERAD